MTFFIAYLIAATLALSVWLFIDRLRFRRRLRESLLLRELYARGQWELRNGFLHEAPLWFCRLDQARWLMRFRPFLRISKLGKPKAKYIN